MISSFFSLRAARALVSASWALDTSSFSCFSMLSLCMFCFCMSASFAFILLISMVMCSPPPPPGEFLAVVSSWLEPPELTPFPIGIEHSAAGVPAAGHSPRHHSLLKKLRLGRPPAVPRAAGEGVTIGGASSPDPGVRGAPALATVTGGRSVDPLNLYITGVHCSVS